MNLKNVFMMVIRYFLFYHFLSRSNIIRIKMLKWDKNKSPKSSPADCSFYLFLFCLACTKFQDFEGEHVEKMLSFSLNYSEILKRNNEQARIAQNEFNEKIKQFTGQDLIETFVEQKKTGIERPSNYPYVLIYESKYFIFFSLTFFLYSTNTIRRYR